MIKPFNKNMRDTISYVRAVRSIQEITDPDLIELREILIREITLELSEPEYMTIGDRVEQLIELDKKYDQAHLETFVREQNVLPLFVQEGVGYYQVTKELDKAITIFFQR